MPVSHLILCAPASSLSRVPQMLPMICKRTQLFILSQMILLIKSRNRLVFSKPTTSVHPVPFLSYQLHLQLLLLLLLHLQFQFSTSTWVLPLSLPLFLCLSLCCDAISFHSMPRLGISSLVCFMLYPLEFFLQLGFGSKRCGFSVSVSVLSSWPPLFKEPETARLIRKRSHLLALSLRWNLSQFMSNFLCFYISSPWQQPFLAFLVSM